MSSAHAAFAISTIVLLVLAVAGLAKIASPKPTVDTLTSLGATVREPAVRLLGLGELALAVAATVTASPALLALAAALHLGFAGVVLAVGRAQERALLAGSGDVVGCGCFGSSSAAPGLTHLAVTLISAAVLALAAVLSANEAVALGDFFAEGLTISLLTVGLIAAGGTLVILLLTRLPELFDSFEPKPPAAAPLALHEQ